MPHRHLVPAYIAVSVAAIAAYFVLGELVASALYISMSALVVVAVLIGLRTYRPTDPRPWIVLALAQAAFLVADVLWYSTALLNPQGVLGPTAADAFYLVGYPLLAVGHIALIRARQPRYRVTAAIDAILVGLAAVLVLWIVAIDGVIHDETIPLVERLVTTAYPIGDALVLAAAVYLLLTGSQGRRSMYLLVLSLAALLMGDVVAMIAASGSAIPSAADLFWLGSYLLFGLAALDPSMREMSTPSDKPLAPEGRSRLILIGAAISMLPAFALYQKFFSTHIDFALIGIVGVVVIVAILVRMHELGAVLGRAQRHHSALLANASDAFAVVKPDGRFTYVSAASERVLGYSSTDMLTRSALDLIDRRARPRAVAVIRRVAAKHGAVEELEVQARRADGEWRWLSVTVTNRTDDPIVDGIVLNYRDITERKVLEQRLQRQAFTDALTGLANRPLFIDRLSHVLARRTRRGSDAAVAVLFLDIDDFKTINDSLGHTIGDKLLVALAERLNSTLRPTDTAARLGGDEFAVLLDGASEADARNVAMRLLATVGAPINVAGVDIAATVSIGVAINDGALVTADELLRDADLAMYAAKSTMAGTFAVYDPQMHAEAMRRLGQRAHERAPRAQAKNGRPTTRWQPSATAELSATALNG
jgi:diguanylate cyclase (GGDEF)-like protein/PAS domain S-box-containing protein